MTSIGPSRFHDRPARSNAFPARTRGSSPSPAFPAVAGLYPWNRCKASPTRARTAGIIVWTVTTRPTIVSQEAESCASAAFLLLFPTSLTIPSSGMSSSGRVGLPPEHHRHAFSFIRTRRNGSGVSDRSKLQIPGVTAMGFLRQRHRQAEIMDRPDLPAAQHGHALDGLGRINFFSRSAGILWRPLAQLSRELGPLRILDVATGAGDVPVRLWRKATRAGLRGRSPVST